MSSGGVERGAVRSMSGRAEENLQFIRSTMERSSTFTAVPGVGGAVMGATGIAAAIVAGRQGSPERWLVTWLAAAAIAFSAGLIAMWRKAARSGATLTGPIARRFGISGSAPLIAGAALTWSLWKSGNWALMPPVWLLLYGAGVLAGGVFTIAAVRLLGIGFMALGVAALIAPPGWANVWLGIGFGGLQAVCGLYIARKHGG